MSPFQTTLGIYVDSNLKRIRTNHPWLVHIKLNLLVFVRVTRTYTRPPDQWPNPMVCHYDPSRRQWERKGRGEVKRDDGDGINVCRGHPFSDEEDVWVQKPETLLRDEGRVSTKDGRKSQGRYKSSSLPLSDRKTMYLSTDLIGNNQFRYDPVFGVWTVSKEVQ